MSQIGHRSQDLPDDAGHEMTRPEPLALATPQNRRDSICVHIFTASATLVGVCLTVIGLLRLVKQLRNVSTLADEFLSLDALAFLSACVIAYVALRTDNPLRRRRIERMADGAFLGALGLMTAACALLAIEFF